MAYCLPVLKMFTRFLNSLTVFGQELMQDPRHIGAACPSSPALARCIARLASIKPGGHVLELGAGTGAITKALLRAGIPPGRLVPVERSTRFAAHLTRRFPKVPVLHGDARDLKQLVRKLPHRQRSRIDCVVSSLPLRSLPPEDVKDILKSVREVLGNRGLFIQYTYAVRTGTVLPDNFWPCGSAVVWLNLPPARVDVFALMAETAAEFVRRERNIIRKRPKFLTALSADPFFVPASSPFE